MLTLNHKFNIELIMSFAVLYIGYTQGISAFMAVIGFFLICNVGEINKVIKNKF